MSRRRFRATSVPLGVTKGHSILKQRSYSPAFHRRPTAFFDDVYEPLPYSYIPKKHYIDTGSEETFLRSEVNRELFLTAAAMEDNYDLAQNSRKRDDEVLSKLNKEIAASETHTSPRSAVASTRANRPHVQPIIVAPVVYSSPPSRPTASRSRKEAALVGSKVEVVRPAKKHSRHPRSKYAQAKLRSMRKDDRGVAEIHPEVTLGLKASRPAFTQATTHRDWDPEYYYYWIN